MRTKGEDNTDLKQINNCYSVESHRIDEYIKVINDLKVTSVYICDLYNDLCNIDYLQECPTVESVNINSKYINNVNGLRKLKNLKNLIIQDIDCDIDLSLLPSIEDISFTWGKNQTNLSSLKNLRRMRIWNYNPKSKDLEEIQFAKKLEELEIIRTTINTLKMIEEFKELKSFGILYAPKLISIEPLISSKSITSISFESCKKVTNFEKLSSMKQLENIKILNIGNLESISFINDLPKLKSFVCLKTNILDCNLTPSKRLEYSAFDNKKEYFSL